ncbi:MAG TPA: protein-disulfide reductase DsbD domain-containing protein [Pyrinomonadaceae bacterium]|jgi:DsbC/DsbD-like thiol-disulfide interchange protein
MRKQFLRAVAAALFVAAGFVLSASAQSVSGSLPTVHKGTPTRGVVYLKLPGGTHANSNRPGNEYQIPTVVKASGARGVKVGAVSYPRGVSRKFAFSETPINVYQGTVPFRFNVTVPATYQGKTVTVNVSVRYQACTDEVCYAPKTKTVTLTANVQ